MLGHYFRPHDHRCTLYRIAEYKLFRKCAPFFKSWEYGIGPCHRFHQKLPVLRREGQMPLAPISKGIFIHTYASVKLTGKIINFFCAQGHLPNVCVRPKGGQCSDQYFIKTCESIFKKHFCNTFGLFLSIAAAPRQGMLPRDPLLGKKLPMVACMSDDRQKPEFRLTACTAVTECYPTSLERSVQSWVNFSLIFLAPISSINFSHWFHAKSSLLFSNAALGTLQSHNAIVPPCVEWLNTNCSADTLHLSTVEKTGCGRDAFYSLPPK